jgi:uncharacterized iron-regulated membrane protein
MNIRFGKSVYKIHKWSGLIAGVFIFILGISGSILVFHDEIEKTDDRPYLTVDNNLPVDIDSAYKTIRSAFKNWEIRLEYFSDNPKETLIFGLRRPAERLTVFVHPANGKILESIDSEKSFIKWVLKLHYSLHAEAIGKTIVFIAGCTFLISLITGLIIYRKAFLDILLFRIKFKPKHRRSFSSSIHRYVGVWAVLLNLIIVISGLLISFDVMTNGFAIKKNDLPESQKINGSLQNILTSVKQKYPEFEANYIRFPKSENAPLILLGSIKGEPFYYSRTGNAISIDPKTGELIDFKISQQSSPKVKLTSISKAIHFVEFDNIFIKLIFCLAGLSIPLLSITGFLLWKFKKKKLV